MTRVLRLVAGCRAPVLFVSLILVSSPVGAAQGTHRPARAGKSGGISALSVSHPDSVQNRKLKDLVRRVGAMSHAGEQPVVVFDIDDTILRQPGNRPVAGVARYLSRLRSAGSVIVYLTGRKTAEEAKTIRALNRAGVPMGDGVHLMLNPSSRKTVLWKERAAGNLDRLGTTVASFDNEMQNTRMFRRVLPRKAEVFHLNTRSKAGDPGGAGKVWVIDDYRY